MIQKISFLHSARRVLFLPVLLHLTVVPTLFHTITSAWQYSSLSLSAKAWRRSPPTTHHGTTTTSFLSKEGQQHSTHPKLYSWMDRVEQLIAYQQQYGHVNVPQREPTGLGRWLHKQRQEYRTRTCTPEKRAIFDSIGVSWNVTDHTTWWTQYQQLATACCQCHHLRNVTAPALLRWLERQRRDSEALSIRQREALVALDPDWGLAYRDWQWECRFRELQAYRHTYGHTCVPISSPGPLAHWVSNQRKLHNRQALRLDRVQRLEAIGFVWNRWDYEFDRRCRASLE